jgi:hypothetical protein
MQPFEVDPFAELGRSDPDPAIELRRRLLGRDYAPFADVCHALRISERHGHRLIARGELPFAKIGGRLFIDIAAARLRLAPPASP